MDISIIAKEVAKFAPVLAGVLETSNPLVGFLINLVMKSIGVESDDQNGAVYNINNSAESQQSLRSIEDKYKSQLQAAQDQHDLLSNVKDARSMRMHVLDVTKKDDWIYHALGISVVFGFFATIILFVFHPLDTTDHDILFLMIGNLISAFATVIGFYFGTVFFGKK